MCYIPGSSRPGRLTSDLSENFILPANVRLEKFMKALILLIFCAQIPFASIVYANEMTRPVMLQMGEMITIDGAAGEVMLGRVPTSEPELSGDFGTLMAWVDEIRTMGVRTNAETPTDAETA